MHMEKVAKTEEKSKQTFTKEQLVKAKKYKADIDVISALLKDDKKYSISEVDEILKKFKEGKVK